MTDWQALAAPGITFGLLGLLVWVQRRRNGERGAGAAGGRRLLARERLALGAQHAAHLLEVDGRTVLVSNPQIADPIAVGIRGGVVLFRIESVDLLPVIVHPVVIGIGARADLDGEGGIGECGTPVGTADGEWIAACDQGLFENDAVVFDGEIPAASEEPCPQRIAGIGIRKGQFRDGGSCRETGRKLGAVDGGRMGSAVAKKHFEAVDVANSDGSARVGEDEGVGAGLKIDFHRCRPQPARPASGVRQRDHPRGRRVGC